jgi:hypothetical protein
MKKRATGSNKFPMQAFHQPFEVNLWGQSTIITFFRKCDDKISVRNPTGLD